MQELTVHISFEPIGKEFQQAIYSSVNGLRNNLRSLEDGTFWINAKKGASTQRLLEFPVIDPRVVAPRLINECFCGVIGSLHDFMNRLLAAKKNAEDLMAHKYDDLLKDADSEELLKTLILDLENNKTEEIARQSNYSTPKKLDDLGITEEVDKNMLTSFFWLRNDIEHRRSIARQQIELSYYRLLSVVNDSPVELPHKVREGDKVSQPLPVLRSRMIAEGAAIQLTEEEIDDIVFTLNSALGDRMIDAMSAKVLR